MSTLLREPDTLEIHQHAEEPTVQTGTKTMKPSMIEGRLEPIRKTRILTVSEVHREWGSGSSRQHGRVPALRLNGYWLGRVGFRPGQKVELLIGAGVITIATVTDPASSLPFWHPG